MGPARHVDPLGLVGRDDQLATVSRWLQERELDGAASDALVLVGEHGCGATALVRAAVASAGLPAERVRRVVCRPSERDQPLALLRRLHAVARPDELVLIDDVGQGDARSVARLLGASVEPGDGGLSGRCVLVVRGGESAPSTSGPLSSPLPSPLSSSWPPELAEAVTEAVVLPPLTVAEVGRVATARGAELSRQEAVRLHAVTGGLPALVVEVLRDRSARSTGSADGVTARRRASAFSPPDRVVAAVAGRLAGLTPAARAVVQATAVARDVALGDLPALTGDVPAGPTIDEAVRSGLVQVRGPEHLLRLRSRSTLLAEAVCAATDLTERRMLHLRAATVADDEVVALAHRAAANPADQGPIAAEAHDCGDALALDGRLLEAAAAYTLAADLARDPVSSARSQLEAIDALAGAGRLEEAEELARDHADRSDLRRVDDRAAGPFRDAVLGYLALMRGRGHEAATLLDRAWHGCNPRLDPHLGATISQRRVLAALVRWDPAALVEACETTRTLAPPGSAIGIEGDAILGLGRAGLGDREGAAAAYADVLARVPDGANRQRAVMGRGWVHLAEDALDEARLELTSALPTTHGAGSVRIGLWAAGWLGRLQVEAGEWDAALQTVALGRAALDRSGLRLVEPLIEWTAAQVCALRGDLAAARSHVDRAVGAEPALTLMHLPGVLARMHLAVAEDDLETVLALGRPLLRRLDETQPDLGLLPWPEPYAHALITLGRLDEAGDVLDRWEPQLRAFGSRSAGARLLALRARVLAGTGAVDEADAAFTEAGDLARSLGRPLLLATTGEAHGRALRRAGRRRESEAPLRRAQEIYRGLGATPALARVERELRAGRPVAAVQDSSATASAGPDLTAQERAIAELVVAGLTNKEVALQLFVSPKTVQYHLTRIYQKLQVRGRAELGSHLRQP